MKQVGVLVVLRCVASRALSHASRTWSEVCRSVGWSDTLEAAFVQVLRSDSHKLASIVQQDGGVGFSRQRCAACLLRHREQARGVLCGGSGADCLGLFCRAFFRCVVVVVGLSVAVRTEAVWRMILGQ